MNMEWRTYQQWLKKFTMSKPQSLRSVGLKPRKRTTASLTNYVQSVTAWAELPCLCTW
ncbi:unnamed protein product [Linum tenue]|uniref:Uncharacterized protein n=1 Tax=Linum tenue TaxID=586396 RepID=A0AAV0MWH2_9ROSI|nr:unnamed protein product [Linum tenue]